MNLQQLRYFNTVVHLENISKAAEYLHISQSALSKQIQHLESELGGPLFDRNGKKITLNKAGKRFYDTSELVLREIRSAENDIKLLVSGNNCRIRIGSAGMPAELPGCLGEFARIHPETLFILNNRIESEEHIDINQFDALICPDDFRFEKLNGFPFFEEKYFFAVNRKCSLSKNNAFNPRFLDHRPLVFMYGEGQLPEFPYRICSAIGMEPGTLYFADTREAHRAMIVSNHAAGFVPASESAGYANEPDIRLIPVLDSRFNRSMKICFLREKHLSELGLEFRRFVIRYFKLEKTDSGLPTGGKNHEI